MDFLKSPDQRATADQILERFRAEKTNPKQVLYALTENGEPLAYIQSRITKDKAIYLGYPWAMPNCPAEVQDKLFTDMFKYVKEKKPKEISYWIHSDWARQIEFFKERGFTRKVKGYALDFNVLETSELKLPKNEFTHRLATENDIALLLELSQLDPDLNNFSEDFLLDYFKNKVLKDGHCVLVFQDNVVVCASAPLLQRNAIGEDYIVLRFIATKPGFENAWMTILKQIAIECVKNNWIDKGPLRFFSGSDEKMFSVLESFNPKKRRTYDLYVYGEK